MSAAVFFAFAQGLWANAPYGDLSRLTTIERFDSLIAWYYAGGLNLDSGHEFSAFNDMLQQAQHLRTPVFAVAAYDLMATYTADKLHSPRRAIPLQRKAIQLAAENNLSIPEAVCTQHLGMIYFNDANFTLALEYMLRAYEKLRKAGFGNVLHCGIYIHQLALIYYGFGNYETALKYAAEAARYTGGTHDLQEQIYNTIALCYRNQGQNDSALLYFKKVLDIAENIGDTAWTGIASGNIGSVYIRQGAFEKAKPFCETDYRCNLAKHQPESVAGALTCLADISIEEGDPDHALDLLLEAGNALRPVLQWEYNRQAYLYETTTKAYAAKKDYVNAYRYQQLAKIVEDSIERRNKAEKYIRIQQEIEAEKHLNEIKQLETERKNEILKRNFSIAGIFLIAIIAIQIYWSQKTKREKEKELHKKQEELWLSEKLRADEELRNAQNQLNDYLESLISKNGLIEKIQAEIDHLRSVPGGVAQTERVETIRALQSQTILTEDDWARFKELFDKAHKGFLIRLKEKYPALTQAEIRFDGAYQVKLIGQRNGGHAGYIGRKY